MEIYTIGHGDKTFVKFVEMLHSFDIDHLVDVRSFPGSRKFPWFGKNEMSYYLPLMGISYSHMPELGGFRKKHVCSCDDNAGWRLASFRNYADYCLYEKDFEEGIERLKTIAEKEKTAYMCSESVPWSCHRSIISDYMDRVHGWKVTHIIGKEKSICNKIHDHAILKDNKLIYPKIDHD